MDILLLTPPLLQLNTPYPATPILAHFLRKQGHCVQQRDLSLELALRVFTPEVVQQAADAARALPSPSDQLAFFIDSADDYARTVPDVVAFLQGRLPELAWRIAARTFLPEGPFFNQLDPEGSDDGTDEENLSAYFGLLGTQDKAKFLASLYMDDLSCFISEALDKNFTFGKYAESLGLSLPSFTPLLKQLESPHQTIIELLLEQLVKETLDKTRPQIVGITIPFPGTLYGAFRIAKTIRKLAPATKLVIGGGYVNSELRNLEDQRVFNYVDFICYDEGFQPWLTILSQGGSSPSSPCCPRLLTAAGWQPLVECPPAPPLLVPDYDGLNLDDYLSIVEMPNPLHRIWSDGKWLKMQLAQGCYWHKCAFCDLSLDYIGRYEPSRPAEIVNAMEQLMVKTGRRGFHFVDEAVAPALLRGVCEEIIKRKLAPVWWGNIRFDRSFTPELAQLMADAGCIAVTGGLECANDRLLKLMNKGITLASAKEAFKAFSAAGILVHAYLMYAFPTETKDEAVKALDFVRGCFADGLLHSAFWHRFALTAHSGIAREPQKYGIELLPASTDDPRFALNEIPYREQNAPDWGRIGKALNKALYNYMLGLGLDTPVKFWF